MMKVHQQLKTITYCFAALIGLILLLIFSGAIGVKTLMQRQTYVDHTNYVMNQLEIAEREVTSADFAGRNQIISGVPNNKLSSLRQTALDKIEEIKQIVADNPAQVENIDSLTAAVTENFKIQDEQMRNVVKTDESITYRLDTTARRTAYNEAIETLFIRTKLTEINLLRNDRMPRLAVWQWRIVYFTAVVITLLLGMTIALFVAHIRLLKRNITAIALMEQAIQKSDLSDSQLHKELDILSKFVRQDITVTKVFEAAN